MTSVNGDPFDVSGEYSASNPTSGLTTIQVAATALADLQITFDFAAGSTNGSFMSTVPEPRGVAPVAVILAVVLGVAAMRRSRLSQKMV